MQHTPGGTMTTPPNIKHLKEGGDVEKRKGPTAGQNKNPVPNDRHKKEQPHTGDPYDPSVQAVSKQ